MLVGIAEAAGTRNLLHLEWEDSMRRREFIITLGGAAMTAAWPFAIATSTGVLAANPDWPKSLTLGTASPGGVYYVYGEALAKILTEKLAIAVNPLPTQGPVHNIKLLDSGGAQLGLITLGVGLQGWNGTGDWTSGKSFRNMRALFPMYDTPFQAIVLQRSGITTLAQLDKKRVSVGPKAGTGGTYIPAILKLLGISADINYGSFEAMATELSAGRDDAFTTLTGAPVPAIQDAESKEPFVFISPSSEEIEVIRKAMPEFSPSKIAAGTYRSLDKDYVTFGVYNFAVGRTDLPDDLVYQLVKAVYENQPRLVQSTSAASDTVPQNVVKDTFLPFHPGAVRYYREIGINIPASLVPTN
jgi:TRAP transporter TAXI family solute receptor